MTTTRQALIARLALIAADVPTFLARTKDNIGGSRVAALRAFLFAYADGACVVCDAALTMALGQWNTAEVGHLIPASAFSASGDRCGYVEGNVAAMCHDCNQAAKNFRFDQNVRFFDDAQIARIPLAWPTLRPAEKPANEAAARRAARGWTF